MKRKITFLTLSFILLAIFANFAKADIIANSYDWRDVYTIMLYSHYLNQTFHFVNNLGEAKILSMTLHKHQNQKIFESKANSVVKNFQKFLQLRGFSSVGSEYFTDYKTLQFDLYRRIKEKIKGSIVINNQFGYDAISVTPYALKNNYWVFFYSPELESNLISLLNSERKSVIFYGEFFTKPWLDLHTNYTIISQNSFMENNRAILELLARQANLSKSWLVVCNGKYLGESYLLEKMPITFTEQSVDFVVNWCKKNGVRLVEVVGPENVGYGQSILDLSNRTIGVIVRTGRTFTGSSLLRGKAFVLRMLPVDEPTASLQIGEIYYNVPSKSLIINIKNNGNIGTYYYLSGIGTFYGSKESFPHYTPTLHYLPAGKEVSISIPLNLSKPPEKVELLLLYGYEFPLKKYGETAIFNVTKDLTGDNSSIQLISFYYDYYGRKLSLILKNNGNVDVNCFGEVYGFNFLGKNRTLFFGPAKIDPGKTLTLSFPIRLEENDLSNNSKLEVRIYYGENPNKMVKQLTETVSLVQKKFPFTALMVLVSENRFILICCVSVAALTILLLILLKKKKKAERGKK